MLQRPDNNPESWDRDRCVDCPTGTYAKNEITAVTQCFLCSTGFLQPNEAASLGIKCNVGDYQPDFGQATCLSCASGGYCDSDSSINGGYTPCSAGTYNSLKGQSDKSSYYQVGSFKCYPCKSGTYADKAGFEACVDFPYRLNSIIRSKLYHMLQRILLE